MKINKMQLFKIAAVILYLLFFLLMQELFTNLENSPYTMMTLDQKMAVPDINLLTYLKAPFRWMC